MYKFVQAVSGTSNAVSIAKIIFVQPISATSDTIGNSQNILYRPYRDGKILIWTGIKVPQNPQFPYIYCVIGLDKSGYQVNSFLISQRKYMLLYSLEAPS